MNSIVIPKSDVLVQCETCGASAPVNLQHDCIKSLKTMVPTLTEFHCMQSAIEGSTALLPAEKIAIQGFLNRFRGRINILDDYRA